LFPSCSPTVPQLPPHHSPQHFPNISQTIPHTCLKNASGVPQMEADAARAAAAAARRRRRRGLRGWRGRRVVSCAVSRRAELISALPCLVERSSSPLCHVSSSGVHLRFAMSHRAEFISAVVIEYMIVGIDQFKPAVGGLQAIVPEGFRAAMPPTLPAHMCAICREDMLAEDPNSCNQPSGPPSAPSWNRSSGFRSAPVLV
jgi:hypothetical protein